MIMAWERFKAWRRGEKKLKGVNRGRCFEKKNDENKTAGKPILTVTAKITRKDGTIEDLGQI